MFPPKPAQPGQTAMMPPNREVMAFRKALGLSEDKPAPEQMVLDAAAGKLGPQVKQMAMTLARSGGQPMEPSGTRDALPAQKSMPDGKPAPGSVPTQDPGPTTPDAGMPGGTEPAPPPFPGGGQTADSQAMQPGVSSDGKMGAATIFGKAPVPSIGAQQDNPDGEEPEGDEKYGASRIFGRR